MSSTSLSTGTTAAGGAGATMDRTFHLAAKTVWALVSIPGRIYRSRQLMHTLAGMDGRELADIGLSRQDLADSSGYPLTSELGAFFAARASERRHRRR